MIFEYNSIKPGGASASFGNNIDTYAGGWAGHVYHAHNRIESAWMNDREMMTFDGSKGTYFGHAMPVAGHPRTLSLWAEDGGTGEHALCASVLSGTGSGQYSRIVGWEKVGTQHDDSNQVSVCAAFLARSA